MREGKRILSRNLTRYFITPPKLELRTFDSLRCDLEAQGVKLDTPKSGKQALSYD
jgi:hypothetical protein